MINKQGWIKRKERYGFSGCRNPEERKRKISENTKKTLALPEVKKKIIEDRKRRKESGWTISNDVRKEISKRMEERWKNGESSKKQIEVTKKIKDYGVKTRFKKGHSVPESWREAVRKSRAKQIFPKENSKIELKIQDFLTLLKIEFISHKYMNIKNSYQCDIFIPSMNLIIECDGDFFHCNPKKYSEDFIRFPNSKNNQPAKEVWKVDNDRTKQLIEKGYKVLRIWEREIKTMKINDFKQRIGETNGM